MSAVQVGSRSHSLKRDRDEDDNLQSHLNIPSPSEIPLRSPPPLTTPQLTPASPARSSTGSPSDADSTTPSSAQNLPAIAPSALDGIALPPKKRAKSTFAEKEEKRIIKEVRDRERAEEKARKEAERRGKEEDKARRDAEKEAERRKKDAEREEKRILKEAERAEKEKEKKAREEEKQRIDEEKKKKERSQAKLNAFFKIPDTSVPTKSQNSVSVVCLKNPVSSRISSSKSPSKNLSLSEYEKRFPPFFVQNNVKIALTNKFERDEKATIFLENILDSYIQGQQILAKPHSFDAATLFNAPNLSLKVRGRKYVPVRHIMSKILGGPHRPIDLTIDSQNMQIKMTRDLLKSVPYKILSFAEDVRPPYKGTYTKLPLRDTKKLARNPFKRDVPKIDYDYDSEAEWVADEGDDLESDGEEDEDGADDEEDLKGFIDDEDDSTTSGRKIVLQGDLEVQSTGLCFEDQNKRNLNTQLSKYRMEIIHDNILDNTPIDPNATHYWASPTPASGLMEPPRGPLSAMKPTSAGVNGPNNKAVRAFGAFECSKPAKLIGASGPKKLVPQEDMQAFKKAIDGSELSKIGLIEVLNKQFPKIPKAVLKATLEIVARRVGSKEAEKRWVVSEDGVGGGR